MYDEELLIVALEANDFKVTLTDVGAEIETFTNGGVNMIHYLETFTPQTFIGMVDDFDVDEEIDLHREGESYRKAFTIRESLKDFEAYHKHLKKVAKNVSKLINK